MRDKNDLASRRKSLRLRGSDGGDCYDCFGVSRSERRPLRTMSRGRVRMREAARVGFRERVSKKERERVRMIKSGKVVVVVSGGSTRMSQIVT